MKIVVINGSPKGRFSISYQYVRYIEKLSKNSFDVIHVGMEIVKLEKDSQYFEEVCNRINNADLVLWIYGVYTCIVPYQLMRFIELIYEKNKTNIFNGKFSSQISTSMHFYDYTAANYIQAIAEDFNMKIILPHIAKSEDMTTEKGEKALQMFLSELEFSVSNNIYIAPKYGSYKENINTFNPQNIAHVEKNKNYSISVITYYENENCNIKKMIDTFVKLTPSKVKIINLAEVNIKSGCIGCLHCSFEGECVIKDEFKNSIDEYVYNSEAIVYAFAIEHHWFNSKYKKFDDRSFANGHRISNMGKPVSYLISGNLKNEPNIREILEARAEVGSMYLTDIVTDENIDTTTENIEKISKKLIWALENKITRPSNFLGVGGMKIFRDLIYTMRGFMIEDHKFYKANNLYDFPHKQKKEIFQGKLIGLLLKNKKMRAKILPTLKETMISKHQKVIDKLYIIK